MKAIVIPKYGKATVLEVREVPDPSPSAGEVRIRVRATGLNFSEVSARQGLYPPAPKPPAVVGYEVAGTIDAVGSGVSDLKVGDRVWALTRFGGHAELACTRATLARRMPDGLGFEQAAAIPVVYATAMMLVSAFGTVREADHVLIHMAAGGVGLAALQLCRKIPGVVLYGTASASKHAHLKRLGLDHPIDYRTQDFEAEVRRITNGRGVDVILDPMGGSHWKKNYRLLTPLGRLMLFGLANAQSGGTRNLLRAAWQIAQTPLWTPMKLMNDNKSVLGLNMGNLFDEATVLKRGLDELAARVADGTIAPAVDQVFPFSKAADAHRRIEERLNVGKVVLVPDGA
jgi:NADPH:quinone reductase-like Zn-dependent oxidoreductase